MICKFILFDAFLEFHYPFDADLCDRHHSNGLFYDVEQECCKQPLYRMDTTGSQVNPKLCVSYASHFVCETFLFSMSCLMPLFLNSYDGNSFNDSPAPPPPPYTPPPPGRSSKRNHRHSGAAAHSPKGPDEESSHGNQKSSHVGSIVGIVSSALFLLLLGLLFLLFCKKKQKRKDSDGRISGGSASNGTEKGRFYPV